MNLLERLKFAGGARLPMHLQSEAAECGLACLAMVAGYYGSPWELTDMRRRLAVSLKGVNLKDLASMAAQLGFAVRPVRLELEELSMLKTPCILHWDLNHFVVLRTARREGIVIHDPAAGVRRLPLHLERHDHQPLIGRNFSDLSLAYMLVHVIDLYRADRLASLAPDMRARRVRGSLAEKTWGSPPAPP